MASESFPHLQTHINRVVTAQISVRHDSLSCNTVVRHSYDLATQFIVLSLAIPIKHIGRHGNKGHVGIDLVEVSANATGAIGPENLAALNMGTISVDRAVLVECEDWSPADVFAG